MTDIFSKKQRGLNMSQIRSKDTKPELKVRKWLFNKRLRYRLHYKIPGKPDIVFPSKNTAIFVNGCFWHQHGCKYSKLPQTNVSFWKKKLENNHLRDCINLEKLSNLKWRVIVIWQCQINTKRKLLSKMSNVYKILISSQSIESQWTK